METSVEAFRIADAATAAGHQVRVVPGTLAVLREQSAAVRSGRPRGYAYIMI